MMKPYFFLALVAILSLSACNSENKHNHDGHNHFEGDGHDHSPKSDSTKQETFKVRQDTLRADTSRQQ